MLSAPVKRIDEILAMPYLIEEFKNQEVPPSDDDSWLYDGEDELNNVLQERQKEIEIYNEKYKKKQKSKEKKDDGPSSSTDFDDFDLGNMAKSMKAFVDQVSSYEGAEVPQNRDMKDVDLDVDRFMEDMESVLKRHPGEENASDFDSEEASSSDMDFDESADDSDVDEDKNDKEGSFMNAYSDVLNKELQDTSLRKSFVRADDQTSKEGTSKSTEDMDEDFKPVDVDFNLVKSLLDSYSSQEGQPGPASNLLGLMGLSLPHDPRKGK